MADEDRPLLHAAVSGDVDVLSMLLRKYGPNVRAFLSGRIPPRWQSVLSEDDVMQQTYSDAFTDIGNFDPEGDGSFSGWLCRLAQCNLKDAIRMLQAAKRGGRVNRVEIDLAESSRMLVGMLTASGMSPGSYAAGKEAEALLAQAMAQLPSTSQIAVRMFDLEGRDVKVIAQQVGRSIGAVYMLRARAHDKLRKLLGATGNFFTDGA
ncbi:MAG: sigma-70 family RNA polymerase sigma factor [Phycisphaerales bacterium]|nr:MAG: sigma-70 family RNA polymerase sigma factor [Phycisphaerales bacterium]